MLLHIVGILFTEDLSVCCRRQTFMFLEKPAEVECILVTNHGGYVGDVVIGSFQEGLCIADPDGKDKVHRCCTDSIFKAFVEPAGAYVPRTSVFFYVDLFVVVFCEVLFGKIDLLTCKA